MVTFRSSRFGQEPDEELINEGTWGRALARFVATALRARGIETREPYAEDWGWELPVEHAAFGVYIGCGHVGGDDDDRCFVHVEPQGDRVFRWFRFHDVRPIRQQIVDAIDAALRDAPDVTEIEWDDPS